MQNALNRKLRSSISSRTLLVLVVLLLIGILTGDDYGISSDEKLEVEMVQWNVELIQSDQPIPRDLKHYGTLFNFASEALYRVVSLSESTLEKPGGFSPSEWQEYVARKEFRKRIRVKHILTFLMFLLTCIGVAGIFGRLYAPKYAWIAPVLMALFPRYWGHSFFNPKDIPFAAMFTVGTWAGAALLHWTMKPSHSTRQRRIACALFGVLVGMVTGIRAGGFILLFFFAVAHLFANGLHHKSLRGIFRILPDYILMLFFWFLTVWAIHPASWSNPFYWFLSTLKFLSAHQWSETVLFRGQFIAATELPWYYLPVWIFITTPLPLTILPVAGFVVIFASYKGMDASKRSCVVLLLLQMLFLPVVAVLGGSTIYDGIRQFLFIIPSMAVLSTFALVRLYERMQRKAVRLTGIIFMLVLSVPVMWDMVELHPYEYCYFNRMFGGLPSAKGRYETDYWGLSMREGMEWINGHAVPNSTVVSSKHIHSSAPFASSTIRVLPFDAYEEGRVERPFYYVARPRWDYQDRFADCQVVYQVVRQNTPLTVVKQCK